MVEIATRRGLAHGAQTSFGARPAPVRTAGLHEVGGAGEQKHGLPDRRKAGNGGRIFGHE
jgi:hypothetical protein